MRKYLVILLGVLLIGLVSAVPLPHAFYGIVNDSNGKIVSGGIITAEIDEAEVGSCNIINGFYDLVVESEYGGLIYFYFNGADKPIANYTFKAFEVTELNFAIEILEQEENDDKDEGHTTLSLEQFCESNWKCGGWSSCEDGLMTRNCYDTNYCRDLYNKPSEVAGCEIIEKVFVEENNYTPVIVSSGILSIVALIVLFILIKSAS